LREPLAKAKPRSPVKGSQSDRRRYSRCVSATKRSSAATHSVSSGAAKPRSAVKPGDGTAGRSSRPARRRPQRRRRRQQAPRRRGLPPNSWRFERTILPNSEVAAKQLAKMPGYESITVPSRSRRTEPMIRIYPLEISPAARPSRTQRVPASHLRRVFAASTRQSDRMTTRQLARIFHEARSNLTQSAGQKRPHAPSMAFIFQATVDRIRPFLLQRLGRSSCLLHEISGLELRIRVRRAQTPTSRLLPPPPSLRATSGWPA